MNKEEFLRQLGESIAKHRLKQKLTQTEVANRCEIERGNLTRIEKGKSNITVETLLKISEAIDIPISQLFSFQKKEI
jgi:transcriptional regulator with XRE-family HTH domain